LFLAIFKRWLVATFGVAAGMAFFVASVVVSVLFIVSGSFALDAWFGLPDWLSIASMTLLALLFPPAALVLGVIGFWYWP